MQSIDLDPMPGTRARLVGYLHDPGDTYIERHTRPCVVVCPGGGYEKLATHEAEPVAMRFYTEGYQAFVLYYTVADVTAPDVPPLGLTPLRDVSVAMLTIRDHCEAWRIDPNKIAVLGFSAGGHLAASLGTLWDCAELKAILDTRNGANRPDAMVLCYPVLTAGEHRHRGSIDNIVGEQGDRDFFCLEQHVGTGTPPAFLWHTVDDESVPVENNLLFTAALQKHHVPFESHLFAHGRHGLSLANAETSRENSRCAPWVSLCVSWLGDVFDFENKQ